MTTAFLCQVIIRSFILYFYRAFRLSAALVFDQMWLNKHKLVKKELNPLSILLGAYDSIEDFLHEVTLIFTNCAKFNKPTSEVGEAGKKLEEMFDGLVQRFLPDYWLHSFVADSPGGAGGGGGGGGSGSSDSKDKGGGKVKRKKRRYVQPPSGNNEMG